MGVTINNKSATTKPPLKNGQQPKPSGGGGGGGGGGGLSAFKTYFLHKALFMSRSAMRICVCICMIVEYCKFGNFRGGFIFAKLRICKVS